MIFHIPHASTSIPSSVRSRFTLSDDLLSQEILKMTDWFTDELFGSYSGEGDAVIVHDVSRMVVDPERFLEDSREPMAAFGMGVIYTHTSDGRELRLEPTTQERQELLESYYHPHHRRLREAVDAELKRRGQALILDCHSFPSKPLPYEIDKDRNRPDICIGTDSYHTPEWLVRPVEELCRAERITCLRNRPFAGAIVPLAYFEKDERVRSIMIEINRRLYMNEADGTKSEGYEECGLLAGRIISALRHAGR